MKSNSNYFDITARDRVAFIQSCLHRDIVARLRDSFLEEFFYRGFAFGLLAKKQRTWGYLLPALAFTVQHILFIHHWMTPLPLALAVGGLFVLALVL